MSDDDITRVTLELKAKGAENVKSAFASAEKVMSDFFRGVAEGFNKELEATKEHQDKATNLAKKVSGHGKEDIGGAFQYAESVLKQFGVGIRRALPVALAAEVAVQAVKAFATEEIGQKMIISTGKETQESVEHLEEQWTKTLKGVRKPLEEVQADYVKLLVLNDELKGFFPLIQQSSVIMKADYESTLKLVNQARETGLPLSQIPALLNRASQALLLQKDEAVLASAQVTEDFRHRGINTVGMLDEILVVVGAMAGPMGSAAEAGEKLSSIVNKFVQGLGESGAYDKVDDFVQGRIKLVGLLDEIWKKNDPKDPVFQAKLRTDPELRDFIENWPKVRAKVIAMLAAPAPDLTKSPMLDPATANAIHDFTESLNELFAAIGKGDAAVFILEKTVQVIRFINDVLNNKILPEGRDLFLDELRKLPTVPWSERFPKLFSPNKNFLGGRMMPITPPGEPRRMAEGGRGPGLAQVGERGGEVIVGPEGVRREINQSTILNLGGDEEVVPSGASTGLPQRHQPGFNKATDRYGPSPEGWYYTNATTYGGHPGDPERGIPYVKDPSDTFGSNQAQVKEQYQGISLPGIPFGGTETKGPELNKLYLVQLPDGTTTLQRVTDTGPGHSGHGGTDMSVGALARMGIRHKTFDAGIRYKRFEGGDLPSNLREGRNTVTAGGFLDTSSGEGALNKDAPEYDIPNRYKPEPTQAFQSTQSTHKIKTEVVPPDRNQIERAARSTVSPMRSHSRRVQQSSGHGKIGTM